MSSITVITKFYHLLILILTGSFNGPSPKWQRQQHTDSCMGQIQGDREAKGGTKCRSKGQYQK